MSRPRGSLGAVLLATMLTAASAAPVRAQRILLQIRPHAGDTLHMRLDQEVDMTRTSPRPGDSLTLVTTTTMFVLMRTIVERTDSSGSDVTAVTDSVASATAGSRAGESEPAHHALQGKRVHMHVAHDGATVVVDPQDDANPELREVLADVPATFPEQPVKVGHTWERTMAAPLGRAFAGRGEIKATFCLDSVSRSGDSAFVSMRGTLGPGRPAPGAGTPGTGVPGGGAGGAKASVASPVASSTVSVAGTMLIDRRRGWLADSHFIIVVESVFAPPAGPGADPTPLRLRMTATQWLRTVDRP